MAAFDFSSSFAGINSALARLGQQNDARWLREAQADVGRSLQGGDYGAAAQKAFDYGDSATGLSLLKLGEAAKDRAADAGLIQGLFNGGASGGGRSLSSLGQPVAAATAPASTGDRSLPRGLRNNNPGNIEDGNFARSLPGYAGTDGRFARFETLDQGVNASERLLDSYGRRGFNTVNAIVNRWAPASENGAATNNYVAFVAKKMGVSPDQPLDMANPEVRRALALAKGEFENGRPVPIGQPAPVQFAQAQGGPQADVPAPGAAPTQFVVPPGDAAATSSLADNPRIQYLQRAYASARTEKGREAIKARMDLEIKDAERRAAEGKTPESVREWQWARQNGLTDAKSPIAYARERADATRQDTAPVTRQIKQPDGSEVVVQWNPDTRRWDPLEAPAGGEAVRPKGVKLTEQQSKDLIYYNRGLQALEAFEPNADAYASGGERIASNVPGGNYIVSEKFQQSKQAGENFLTSILRKDTGAAITNQEQEIYGRVFLPQPGDKPAVLTQKAEARKQAIDALRSGLGPAEVLALGQRLTTRQPGESAPQKPDQGGWQDLGGGIRIREKR